MDTPHLGRSGAAVVLVLSLVGCGPDAPTPEDARREAASSAVRQASAATAAQTDAVFAELVGGTPALTEVATSTSDDCHAGVADVLYPHDPFRLRCSWGETRYFAVRGELLDALRQMDVAAKQAGVLPVSGEALDGVEFYVAANGLTEDGQVLPLPTLTYVAVGYGGRLSVRWFRASDPRPEDHSVDVRWPMVWQDDHRVDVDALWNGPLRGQAYLLTVSTGVTYHEVPWPS
ncbi:hypothetical protein AB0C15_09510 [Micromonospora sp. NPDC048835]|uniref:hypothetical protein n=1 Tax=Micromonospora sp. NPDC048835 TaxID=3155147 RepID=UPI0033F4E629